MPNLPPFFNGKISGVLILSILNISWYDSFIKNTYVQFEWTGCQEKQKLFTSKNSKITYDIRTSYKSFLHYLSTSTLRCSVKNYENKTLAHATMINLSIDHDNQLIKTIPLMNNEKIVGTLKLCFNVQTFNDTSFDNDIKMLKQFGIQDEVSKTSNDKEFYYSEILKHSKNVKVRPISSSSLRSNKSKEELTSDYLMGKNMAPDEEEEALNTLRIMPNNSTESLVSAAEKIGIYSPPQSPLHIQGCAKVMAVKKHGIKNMKTIQENLKKSCEEFNKGEFKTDFSKKLHKVPMPKDDVHLHLSILSVNVYRSAKPLQNYTNSTYIVQCLKDQEPYKLLRFMTKHVDNNTIKFKNVTQSSRLEGSTAKGVTIKVYVRLLSERCPIVLGETKQMLDWTGFSTTFSVPRFIKVPIWNNDKIIGHLSLSYEFSRSPIVQKYEINFPQKQEDILMDNCIENHKNQLCKPIEISNPVATINNKKLEDYKDTISYQTKDQIYMYNRLYPESIDDNFGSQLMLNEFPKIVSTKAIKDKEIQTNFEIRQLNKSVQTQIKTFNVAIQVNSDELEDPLDKSNHCDVQNIFRCTHEFTLNIEKKCDSTFNYVTYQFPECVTNNIGKVISSCRAFRTFGNTNILHLITLPTTIPLETYFYNNYNKAAIVLNLHKSNDDPPEKVSLLMSHLIDMANKFKNSHIAKHLIINKNLSIPELSLNNVKIQIHYKRVYHSFPSLEPKLNNLRVQPHKTLKKNSNIIVDLTESDSEDAINKTYTLLKHNDRIAELTAENSTQTDPIPVKMSHNCITQTENNVIPECITIDDDSISIKNEKGSVMYTDTIAIVKNRPNCTNEKITQNTTIVDRKFINCDIFKAKVTIVGGYNLPMVKLNGDTIPSAPTTYVIMEAYGSSSFSTSSVVQQTNPIWNSEWSVVIPRNNLIEGKWLIFELWCKKYKNEYAGHDPKRDMRLGFIIIDLSNLKHDLSKNCELYDVISETEEHHGKIKVMINQINCIGPCINTNCVPQPINERNTIQNKSISQKSTDGFINEMIGKMRIEDSFQVETRNPRNTVTVRDEKCNQHIDLTEDSLQKFSKSQLKNTVAKSSLNGCLYNNDNIFDNMGTISSVTSWTSSSDDILCSNNSQIVNNILSNKTKMNRIKQIIRG
ncbi:uncharacterized protein LOC132943741 isoform X1 [Metopolophium dirhodum]|uniref:uncharacterized protein LOC132943741 isoform X1 n=1 Tax=Metopolophium dirhodum TaxID=44670 RepID=UPI00298FC46A|nr:uncharacterized protein LOC132943741 isoform X1 [Metopolophium dirhodum]